MSASLLLQYSIVALAVLVSAGVVMHKQFPNAARRCGWRWHCRCCAPAVPYLDAHAGKKIAPPGQGGGNDCGGCNGCG